VAVLREMAAIILTGGNTPDQETKAKANEEGIPVLLTPLDSYSIAGRLHAAGVVNEPT
jgi:predicted transcriptional regulator